MNVPFPGFFNAHENLLPRDGSLTYFPNFFSEAEADYYLQKLQHEIYWKAEKILMFGKILDLPRLTAWYGDPGKVYSYSKIRMEPNNWNQTLIELKDKSDDFCGEKFNSLLLNLYRNQADHVSWHSDDEPELGINPTIASLSFGAVRKFQVKHRYDKHLPLISLELAPGSMVMMSGEMQKYWIHRIAPTKRDSGPRINLTFRNII